MKNYIFWSFSTVSKGFSLIFKPNAPHWVLDRKLVGTDVPTFHCGLWPQWKATRSAGGRLLIVPAISNSD
jgi:hypothetical protein